MAVVMVVMFDVVVIVGGVNKCFGFCDNVLVLRQCRT
jgi:hypothetical protein